MYFSLRRETLPISVFTGTLFRCFVVNVDSFDNITALLPQGQMMLTLHTLLTNILCISGTVQYPQYIFITLLFISHYLEWLKPDVQ